MDYNYQIRLRRGTSTQWELSDPVLLDGEPGYDTTLNYYKIGDGVRRWSELPWTTGLKGDPATVDAGSTTTVDYDSMARVENVGTTQNAIFDFEIPEGKPGKDLFIHEGSAQSPPVDWLPRELLWDPDAEAPDNDISQAYIDAGDAANSAETQAVADELALVEDALQDVKVWAGDPTPLHVNSTLSEWLSDLADEVHHLSARPAFALDGILHVDMYNGFARVFSNTPELEIGGEKWVEFELATTPAPGGTIPPGTNAIASSAGALVRAGGTQGPVIGETGGAVSQMALANYISQNRICRILYDLTNPVRPTLKILETLDAIPTGSSALHLGALYDVTAPVDTPAGKVLGTVAEGSWGPVDPPAGGGGGLPSGTLTGQMIFWNGTSWTVAATADVLTASRFKPHSGAAFRIMDDSSVVGFRLNSSGAVFFSDTTIANGGKGVIGIANATTVPTSSPTNASLIYVEGGVLTVRNASATASPVATNSYVDSRTPPILVLGPTDPVPGGTAAGTVIVRKDA